jgi:hypothetical protein
MRAQRPGEILIVARKYQIYQSVREGVTIMCPVCTGQRPRATSAHVIALVTYRQTGIGVRRLYR